MINQPMDHHLHLFGNTNTEEVICP
jgi:hypothetical protein